MSIDNQLFWNRPRKAHNRYEFSGISARTKYTFPDGKKLAVYIGVNLEDFDYDQVGALGANIGGSPRSAIEPDILNWGWRDYGMRVGVWRLLQLLDDFNFPTGALINVSLLETMPEVIDAFIARGDEPVGHGVTNSDRQGELSENNEKAMIEFTTSKLEKCFGKRPVGWLSPWISQSHFTLDLLQEAVYTYQMDWAMDDQPIPMKTRNGKIMSIPYNHEVCDIPAILAQKLSAIEYKDLIIDQFDEMLETTKRDGHPLVMSIPLHPYIVGQPFRLRQLRLVFQHLAKYSNDIWVARPSEIINHIG